MQLTLNWLKRHLNFQLDNQEDILYNINQINQRLIDLGVEVEYYRLINSLLVVKIQSFKKISDKLSLCDFEIPEDLALLINYPTKFQVLCGADNVRQNMITVLCPIGTKLPNGMIIGKRTMMGIESFGMLVSGQEIGEDETDGILDLQIKENSIYKYQDILFDIKVPANRVDLYSVRGIARELASSGIGVLKDLKIETPQLENQLTIENNTDVRFSFGQIDNFNLDPSINDLLESIGKKSESKYQQLQDFCTIDIGFPLAIYDTNYVNNKIIMNKINKQISFNTVISKYETEGQEILIKSETENLCIGGVVNIKGFTDQTKNIILESACFSKENFNTRSGYITESEKLFYLGVDQELPVIPYIYTLCNGEKYKIKYINGENYSLKSNLEIFLSWGLWSKITEYEFSMDQAKISLEKFGFKVEVVKAKQSDSIHDEFGIMVKIPSWRKDIEIAEDLIGEIVRINNLSKDFENVLYTPEIINLEFQSNEEKLRTKLVNNEYYEVINIPFSNKGDFELKNSIDDSKKFLRNNLIDGLLNSMHIQINNNNWGGKLFEIGKIYPSEKTVCAILIFGKMKRNWLMKDNLNYDFFTCKKDFMKLFNLVEDDIDFENNKFNDSLEYGLNFKNGYIGKISTHLIKNNKINNVFYGELNIDNINNLNLIKNTIQENKFYIDFSVEFKEKIKWSDISYNIKNPIILFDTYDDGKKYSFTIEYNEQEKKSEISEFISNKIKELGGKIR